MNQDDHTYGFRRSEEEMRVMAETALAQAKRHHHEGEPMTYTVTHSEWSEDPYGWQVRDLDGQVIDVYQERELAEAYAQYMNERRARYQANPHPATTKENR